jgi:TetR/AcrR family transcriptional repressor of nem operon
MARPKEFDPDEVLERVMVQFWLRGYEGTSMDDLVRAAGIGRQSLYNEFGDKRALYLKALDRYGASDGAAVLAILAQDGPIREILRRAFDAVLDMAASDRDAKGCMLLNAATNMSAADSEVKKRVCTAQDELERALLSRLKAAQKAGEIAKRHDPVALSRFFAANLFAIRTTAKTVRDRAHLASIADLAMSVIG